MVKLLANIPVITEWAKTAQCRINGVYLCEFRRDHTHSEFPHFLGLSCGNSRQSVPRHPAALCHAGRTATDAYWLWFRPDKSAAIVG